jgi:hypothetical protein
MLEMEFYNFFCFLFINLFWSHDPDNGFNILTRIDLSFFVVFLIDFFSISSSNTRLVINGAL